MVQAGIANPREGCPTGSMKKPESTYHEKTCIYFAKKFARQHEKALYSCVFQPISPLCLGGVDRAGKERDGKDRREHR